MNSLEYLLASLGLFLFPLVVYLVYVCFLLPLSLGYATSTDDVTKGLEKLPRPIEIPFIGSILTFVAQSNFLTMPPIAMEYYENLDVSKKFSRMSIGVFRPQLMVLVNDADTAHHILSNPAVFLKGPGYDVFRYVTPGHLPGLDGEGAARIRHVLTKAFSKAHQARFAAICASKLTAFFQTIKEKGEQVEVSERLREIALDSVAEALLGSAFPSGEETSGALSCVMMEWHARVIEILPLHRVFPASVLPRQRRVQQALGFLRSHFAAIVQERGRASGRDDREDMLDVIIREGLKMQPPLTPCKIFNAVFTTLSMGHENVSTGMSWAVALLAQDAGLQEKILQEFSGCSTAESIADKVMTGRARGELTYTSATVKETLRLYPSIPILSRQAQDAQTLNGVVFPGATSRAPVEFIICPWALHRSKHFWGEDVAEFKPSRWVGEEAVSALNRRAYIPFGAGARACLGMMFAHTEMSIALGVSVLVLEKFTLAGAKPEPKLEISLRPRCGVWIKADSNVPAR
jgi:cytochrome P450